MRTFYRMRAKADPHARRQRQRRTPASASTRRTSSAASNLAPTRSFIPEDRSSSNPAKERYGELHLHARIRLVAAIAVDAIRPARDHGPGSCRDGQVPMLPAGDFPRSLVGRYDGGKGHRHLDNVVGQLLRVPCVPYKARIVGHELRDLVFGEELDAAFKSYADVLDREVYARLAAVFCTDVRITTPDPRQGS